MTGVNPVPTVQLGDELSVSAIGFGGMALTPVYGEVDDTESLATLNKTVDATKTFKYAAILKLARDEEFQAAVRSDRGIKWGRIQHKLADNLPGTFGQGHEERSGWAYRHGLVRQALNEILGEDGWRTESRERSQWVFATDRAKPRSAALRPPGDRSPDDELGPPPEHPPF